MLFALNQVLAQRDINIEQQVLDTRGEIGYAIYDINRGCDQELIQELGLIPHTIRVRAASLL
jgi:D-3-phosphoglycerate dehydrogenase